MDLLLDAHTFIWFVSGDKNLSEKARHAIENPSNRNHISIISIWEITIKHSIGKLYIKGGINSIYKDIISNNFELLPLGFEHTMAVSSLEFHHRDPFDRILIAQAMTERMAIVSKDQNFKLYDVKIVW